MTKRKVEDCWETLEQELRKKQRQKPWMKGTYWFAQLSLLKCSSGLPGCRLHTHGHLGPPTKLRIEIWPNYMPQANLMETFTELRFPHSRFVKVIITSPSVIALMRKLITVKTQTILSLRSCVNFTIYSSPYKSQSSKNSTLKFQDLFKNPKSVKKLHTFLFQEGRTRYSYNQIKAKAKSSCRKLSMWYVEHTHDLLVPSGLVFTPSSSAILSTQTTFQLGSNRLQFPPTVVSDVYSMVLASSIFWDFQSNRSYTFPNVPPMVQNSSLSPWPFLFWCLYGNWSWTFRLCSSLASLLTSLMFSPGPLHVFKISTMWDIFTHISFEFRLGFLWTTDSVCWSWENTSEKI